MDEGGCDSCGDYQLSESEYFGHFIRGIPTGYSSEGVSFCAFILGGLN